MIREFADKRAAAVFANRVVRGFPPDVLQAARRKLAILDAAETLADLRAPPGNRLEALAGDRAGQYSIRINDRWRLCFEWRDDGPHAVEITDYHD
jgi:proteic killer suppression protein